MYKYSFLVPYLDAQLFLAVYQQLILCKYASSVFAKLNAINQRNSFTFNVPCGIYSDFTFRPGSQIIEKV